MLGDVDTTREHSGATNPAAPAAPPELRLMDRFAGRVLVQGVSLLTVAAIVATVVDHRAAETSARLTDLETKLQLVQYERDRMQRLSEALTTELNEAAVEAEIVRWQLSYTEERYARLQDTASGIATAPTSATPTPPPGPPATFVSLDTSTDAPGYPSAVLPPPAAVLALSESLESRTDAAPVQHHPDPRTPTTHDLLALEPFDGSGMPPTVRHPDSQLERDRAFSIWQEVMRESAARECDRRTGAAERRCHARVKRTLIPVGSRAVECILSGNASADYVADIPLDQLPTHSVPLEKGAVILCDRGLRNL